MIGSRTPKEGKATKGEAVCRRAEIDFLNEAVGVFTKIMMRQERPSPLLVDLVRRLSFLARLRDLGLVGEEDLRRLERSWLTLADYLDGLSSGAPGPGSVYSEACRLVEAGGLRADCARLRRAIVDGCKARRGG